MNIARNKQSRQTAQPPRCIRGCSEHLSRTRSGNYRALWTLALLLFSPTIAVCQVGQTPMQNSDGLVNRAVQGIGNLNAGGAGRMYYGVNGADRGLGYRGSYMTLGGYFPALEDDYGGLWAADTRGHFSNYAGFFTNIGAVRKQLLNGGSLLGFGLFWDYDGDQNQYPDQIIGDVDPMTFAGGYSYNQVGVSGELLTDWGNMRSNGYIPVGRTGQSTGKYVSRNILCMQGINAALGGADFELGAYLPGLADWAGMINVGGYTYGNTRYQLDNGADLVPWFGGVYTRLDMTFVNNWDFSLQYNNDSYFDSTGFARLTYRLGKSRRRNVPDQMEQPMMRNEHIVRAHQNAVVARNPITGLPWRVIHVNNNTTSPATGNGSFTNPVASLGGPLGGNPDAQSVATEQYDIILVHSSTIPYSNPAGPLPGSTDMFTFQESNQYLIGDGSAQTIPTIECGDLLVSTSVNPALYPILAPQAGDTAIFIPATLRGETISGFDIRASDIGIDAQSTAGRNTFSDLTINGGLVGIRIGPDIGTPVGGGSDYDMTDDIAFNNQLGTGLQNNGRGDIQLTNSTFSNIAGTAIRTDAGALVADSVTISDTGGDAIIVGGANQALVTLSSSNITNSQLSGIVHDGDGTTNITSTTITGSGSHGIQTTTQATGAIAASNSSIDGTLSAGSVSQTGILMQGTTSVLLTSTTIRNAIDGVQVTGNAQLEMANGGIRNITNDGIALEPISPGVSTDGFASLTNVTLADIGDNGIRTVGQEIGGGVSFISSSMFDIGQAGILASQVGNATGGSGALVRVAQNSSINSTGTAGIQVTDSNLRVSDTTFANNGNFGINSIDGSTVAISDSTFSGTTTTAIQATASNTLSFTGAAATGIFNDLTASDNTIRTQTNGINIQGGIILPAGTTVLTSQGVVRANLLQNNISVQNGTATAGAVTASTTLGINLVTDNGVVGTNGGAPNISGGLIDLFGGNGVPQGIQIQATSNQNLSALNNGETVSETPTPSVPNETAVDYNLNVNPTLPPQ